MDNRKQRLQKLADIANNIQEELNSLLPENATHTSIQPGTDNFDPNSATDYNSRSEETFKQFEPEIKKALGTAADWKSPEFAQAVYQWQKNNGLTGKWIDGKFGPVTMAALTKASPSLNQHAEASTPWLPDGKVKLRLTGYWPFSARSDERKMEGGIFDRKMPEQYKNQPNSKEYQQHILHTVEQYFADPVNHPFVSLSGDDAIWPYGQELVIPWTNGRFIRGRVVDTGSHFRGAGKVIRTEGYEPIDVCVDSAQTKVPTYVVAQVVGNEPKKTPELVASIRHLKNKRIKKAKLKARALVLKELGIVK